MFGCDEKNTGKNTDEVRRKLKMTKVATRTFELDLADTFAYPNVFAFKYQGEKWL